MRVFKDAIGRDWTIDINLGTREIVKAKTGVDFLDLETCVEKLSDLATLGAVLYALCEPQIEKLGLKQEDFVSAFKGDVFDAASAALNGELIDFFPSGRRQILQRTLAKAKELETMALDHANKMIDSGKLEEQLRQKLNERSGDLPPSPEYPELTT